MAHFYSCCLFLIVNLSTHLAITKINKIIEYLRGNYYNKNKSMQLLKSLMLQYLIITWTSVFCLQFEFWYTNVKKLIHYFSMTKFHWKDPPLLKIILQGIFKEWAWFRNRFSKPCIMKSSQTAFHFNQHFKERSAFLPFCLRQKVLNQAISKERLCVQLLYLRLVKLTLSFCMMQHISFFNDIIYIRPHMYIKIVFLRYIYNIKLRVFS